MPDDMTPSSIKLQSKSTTLKKYNQRKTKKDLTLEETVFTVQNTIQRAFRLNINQKCSQKCQNLES